MTREERDTYVGMIARVFVRALRDPHGAEEFELSEGQATSLLMERERSTGAAHWRRELRGLCELIIERATHEETSTHIAITIEEPDGNFVLTRAERLLHELDTTTFHAHPANLDLADRLRQRAHWARTAQHEGNRAYITELDAKLFDEAALAINPVGRGLKSASGTLNTNGESNV